MASRFGRTSPERRSSSFLETWRLFGGTGPAAWQASKAEQDRVAARIWAGGAGAHNWVCASLVA